MSDEVPPPPGEPDALPTAELELDRPTLDRLASVYSMDVQLQGVFVPTREQLPVGAVIALQMRRAGADADDPALQVLTRVAEQISPSDPRGPGLRLDLLEVRPNQMSGISQTVVDSIPAPPKAHVLVVDDEPLAREEAAVIMREAGYQVSTARNGVEALSTVLGEERIDLILTDLNMPTMDGWQLLRLVRSRSKVRHIPIVFLTTLTSDEERLKGYELGVSDYMEKPVDADQLQATVVKHLAAGQATSSGPPVMRGDLSHVALGSLLSLLELERRSGRLQVDCSGERAVLWLHEGMVVRVDMPGAMRAESSMARLMHVLDWTTGDFQLSSETPVGEPEMSVKTSYVLLEHARLHDEARNR